MQAKLIDETPIWFRITNAAGVGMATCAREREAEETARLLHSLTGEVYTINRVSLAGEPSESKPI